MTVGMKRGVQTKRDQLSDTSHKIYSPYHKMRQVLTSAYITHYDLDKLIEFLSVS